jgi:hypothetical protein
LPEADVALQEPLHRHGLAQVRADLLPSFTLPGRQRKGQGRAQALDAAIVRRDRVGKLTPGNAREPAQAQAMGDELLERNSPLRGVAAPRQSRDVAVAWRGMQQANGFVDRGVIARQTIGEVVDHGLCR